MSCNNKFFLFFGLMVLMFPLFVHAGEKDAVKFVTPLACAYGEDCWSVRYVDVGSGNKAIDFKCNHKTNNGHTGTDFALRSVAQMKRGVDVLAAASGKVLRLRDGQADAVKTADEAAELQKQKKECGNGVLIDHGDGLKTIYCHLKQDSIVVKPNQSVKAGQKIAQVGLSGATEFPHVHMGVHWEGSVIDPFTGASVKDGCGEVKTPMWHKGLPVAYEPVIVFDGGFRSGSPDFESIGRGEENPEHIDLTSAGFVFWVGFYNVEQGDVVDLIITDPNGAVFVKRQNTVPQTRPRQYYFTGRKIGRVQLMIGEYKGYARIQRGDIVRERSFSVEVR